MQRADNRASLLTQFHRELAAVEGVHTGAGTIAFVDCPEPRQLFSELDPRQQSYYLLFRRHFLTGKSLRGDTGYVTLLAQEIVNGIAAVDDPVMSLFVLVLTYAPNSAHVQRHGAEWVLALNAKRDMPQDAGQLAALLTRVTKRVLHRDLVLDGVLDLAMDERNLELVNLSLVLGLSREDLPLLEFTHDLAFAGDVTRIAVASFFSAHTLPIGTPGGDLFSYWTDPGEKPVLLDPFPGLLHDLPPEPLQVGAAHTYSDATIPAARAAVTDAHRYVLYLARATEEPETPDPATLKARTNAARPLSSLVDERLPQDLRRKAILVDQQPSGGISIAIETGFGTYSYPGYSTEKPEVRYERAKEAHLELLNKASYNPPSYRPQLNNYSRARDLLDLSDLERREYIYWRTQWRMGRAERTSSAPVLRAYTAEVINLWGFDSPQAAYDELVRLAQCFGRTHYQLSTWAVDFATVHEVSETPNAAALRQYRSANPWANPAEALLGWMEARDYSLLDRRMIPALGFPQIGTGKFYEVSKKTELFEQAIPSIVQAVDEHFLTLHGVGVFERLLPRKKWKDYNKLYRRWSPLFEGLTHAPGTKRTRPLHTVDHDHLTPLQRLIGNAIKYAENAFRKQEGISAKRRVEQMAGWTAELRAAIDAVLDPLLNPPKPKPRVTYDPDLLASIERDSAAVREQLIDPAVLAEAEREAQQQRAQAHASDTRAADTVTAVGAGDEYGELVTTLEAGEKRLLTLVVAGATKAVLVGVARELRAPLDLVIDRINERALDTIGDNVIDTYEDPPVIIDEHQDPLRRALEEGTT